MPVCALFYPSSLKYVLILILTLPRRQHHCSVGRADGGYKTVETASGLGQDVVSQTR
jgi:hypothetical protein